MKFIKVILTTILLLIIIAAIILGGLFAYRYTEKTTLTDAIQKAAPGSYIALSDGVTHYQLSGPDTGQVVILLHGFSVPYFIWDGTYEYLAKQGFRVLRYDDFGRGFSDRPNIVYTKELYFKQLNELIGKLKLRTPVALMGVSFGGKLATDFTDNYPSLVNKVVLVDPVYPDRKPDAPELVTNYMMDIHPDDRANSQLTDFKYPRRHPDWVNRYKVQMQYKGFTHALVSTLYHYPYNAHERNSFLNTLHKPVLLIWGKDDTTVPFTYSDSIRSVLKVDFFPVDDAAHLPYIEQPDKVNAKIGEFLKEK